MAAGVLLVVAGVGIAGTFTRHGPFFWKAFRSRSDPAVAKLAAEGRQLLAQDAFPSDQKALQLAQQGLAIRGDDPQGVRLLAAASAALAARGADGQGPRARQLASALVADDPASWPAQEARLAADLATGDDPGQAAAALEKVLPAAPDPETLFLLARAALVRGDPARASALLDRLDARLPGLDPVGPTARRGRVQKGDDKAARAILAPAVAKDPANAAAALDLAALLERAGDPAAEAALVALLEKERMDRLGPAERARARLLLASALARRGDADGAEAELARAMQDWAGRHRRARGARPPAAAQGRSREGHRRAGGHPGRHPDAPRPRRCSPGRSSPPGSPPTRRPPWTARCPASRTTPTCSS